MRRHVSALLTFVCALGCFTPLAHAGGEKGVRKELESNYARIVRGFKNNDPTVWEGFLVPDFKLKLFSGSVQDRAWAVNYVSNNAKTFKVKKLSMRIKDLKIEGSDATAVVEQKSSRTFEEQGEPHRLDVGALQRETWTRTPAGWRLKSVEEWKVLYVLKDGKPMSQS
jgi:hypothetical protein